MVVGVCWLIGWLDGRDVTLRKESRQTQYRFTMPTALYDAIWIFQEKPVEADKVRQRLQALYNICERNSSCKNITVLTICSDGYQTRWLQYLLTHLCHPCSSAFSTRRRCRERTVLHRSTDAFYVTLEHKPHACILHGFYSCRHMEECGFWRWQRFSGTVAPITAALESDADIRDYRQRFSDAVCMDEVVGMLEGPLAESCDEQEAAAVTINSFLLQQ